MAIYYPTNLRFEEKRQAPQRTVQSVTGDEKVKRRLNILIAGILPSIACHILSYGLFALLMIGLHRYGPNALRSALDNGLVFGMVFGILYGSKELRWQQGAILEVVIYGGFTLGGILFQALTMPNYDFGMQLWNMVDPLGASALAGALSVLGVKVAKWHLRHQIYPDIVFPS